MLKEDQTQLARSLQEHCPKGMYQSTIDLVKRHYSVSKQTISELLKSMSDANECIFYFCSVATGVNIARSGLKLLNNVIEAILAVSRNLFRCGFAYLQKLIRREGSK